MYCFTYASSYDCIFNELLLWSKVSAEHPVFIKKVASLSGKNLSQGAVEELMEFNKDFGELSDKVRQVREMLAYNGYYRNDIGNEIKKLVTEFLIMDEKIIEYVTKIKTYGQEDQVWQTLLHHIAEEQTLMKKLFTDLSMQI